MSQATFVNGTLYAYFAPDFVSEGPVLGTVDDLVAIVAPLDTIGPTRIRDARRGRRRGTCLSLLAH